MVQTIIQHSFHAGEWAPALNARVDLAKYHAAAATMRNFFVDYRGGASSRMGTKFILPAYRSATPVRLISFQASFLVGYILEFGELYIRPFYNGAPVLEATKTITNITQANPAIVTSAAHGYTNGQWVFVTGVLGMTQVNGKYYQVAGAAANTFQLQDLNGVNIDSSAFTAYASAGTSARVYTLTSPYHAADLQLLKFALDVNTMVLTHINYPPQLLTLITAANWTIAPINFASTQAAPAVTGINTTLSAGGASYAYVVTGVDANGQESVIAGPGILSNKQDLRTNAGSITVVWTPSPGGADSYNVYKAELAYGGAVPAGASFGFIGNARGLSFVDSNIDPDFQLNAPIVKNPFSGSGIQSINSSSGGVYAQVPNVIIGAPPPGGTQAVAQAIMHAAGTTLVSSGSGYAAGDTLNVAGLVLLVNVVGFGGGITNFSVQSSGSDVSTIPVNPVAQSGTSGHGVAATFQISWTVVFVNIVVPGTGYLVAPAISFSPAGAVAVAVLGASSAGNPAVPTFFQQRLVLAAPPGAVQTFYMSQPGSYFNFNISNPIQPDDAITASIVMGQLNEIKSMISMPTGLIILSNKAAWQISGGSPGSAVTPIDIVANAHAYNGASDVPPIVANFDILYVQSKGSIVRDLTYNFYANIFTGTDISVLSSHLFFGYSIHEWAWAEEPFKIVWAIRNDGTMLSLTFLKEQELVGWARHDTQGVFQSVATVTETIPQGAVDAIYFVVQRVVNGNTVQYIERMADRYISDYITPWCVDCGLQYIGSAPATNFSGMEHLAGAAVVGLADGIPFTATISATGTFVLATAATTVTVGLAFIPQLKTLQLDTGEPTIQGKRKKIHDVTVRVEDTLGLSMGSDFSSLVVMKDLVLGNLGSQTNEVVTGLVTGDAMTLINPNWDPQGQYAIQQSLPYPATILGVIPNFVVGDTPK